VETLYLIDGYAQFFRAYHAIRTHMTSPVTKEPTNLTFGFVGMLLKLLRGAGAVGGRPDYLAVALDVSGDRGTFRSEIYPEYKATRPPPPEDLPQQVDRCLSTLDAIGVPMLGVESCEADDVIASVVRSLGRSHPDVRIRIVSKDKDLKQLLEPGRVELFDVHNDAVIDAEALRTETGLEPSQVVDMLALMGDTIDNVPGVEGVGAKTAASLIAQHGSLDALLANAHGIKGKRGEKLRAAGETLELSRRLVTLRDDLDVPLDLERARVDRLDLNRLGPILRELGFNRYRDELSALLGSGATDAEGAGDGGGVSGHPDGGKTRGGDDADGAHDGGLFAALDERAPIHAEGDYRCVTTEEALEELAASLRAAGRFAIDTETTSVRAMRAELCGISVSAEPGTGAYIPVRAPEGERALGPERVLRVLGPLIEDPSIPKLGHNLKYDQLVLRRAGVELRGFWNRGSRDSMVASYLLDASRSSHSLDALSLGMLGHTTIPIKDLIGSGKSQRRFDEVPLDRATPYACEDADLSLRLCERMENELERAGLAELEHTLELPLVAVLAEMQWNGIRVDPNELDRQRERLVGRIEELRARIREEAEESTGRVFDPDSPRQLAGILFNKPDAEEPGLGLRPLRRGKTGPSTDAEVLGKLAEDPGIETPIPALVLEHRSLSKLVGTYLVALRQEIASETGRIHASFNQTVAATGRLSSSGPNLQNIPIRTEVGREIRRAFVAPESRTLISADYSQIELRLLAHLSGDAALTEAFHAGEDIHTAVAAQVHGVAPGEVTREMRSGAKMVNFGIVYGVTPYGLARRLGISNTEAGEIIDGYKARFSGITTFLDACVEYARVHGYVETIMGRRRPITEIDSKNPSRRALAERMAINSVVQGSAADLIKVAMVDLHVRLSPRAGHLREGAPPEVPSVLMLLQIHDELVFEADEAHADAACALIRERMERAMELSVPLVVETAVSPCWYDGK